MLLDDRKQTMEIADCSIKRSRGELVDPRAPDLYLESLGIGEEEKSLAVSLSAGTAKIDPVVNVMLQATSGNLYKHLKGGLEYYPIPELRLRKGRGKRLLDIGCNWGRWSIAAARLGYQVTGIDPSLGAVMAARRVSANLGLDIKFVVGDARFSPFAEGSFDTVFSYSVLQHLDNPDLELCLKEVSRLLHRGGLSVIQMANKFGIRSIYHQAKKKLSTSSAFEVKYRKPSELKAMFSDSIGETSLEADCFFGLGIQRSDMGLMPLHYKAIIISSELLRLSSRLFPFLVIFADSLYMKSIKSA